MRLNQLIVREKSENWEILKRCLTTQLMNEMMYKIKVLLFSLKKTLQGQNRQDKNNTVLCYTRKQNTQNQEISKDISKIIFNNTKLEKVAALFISDRKKMNVSTEINLTK